MIYVEQHILDPKTYMPTATYMKTFTSRHEFNRFYKLAKQDGFVLINILYYDPHKNPGQKSIFDARLFGVSREIMT